MFYLKSNWILNLNFLVICIYAVGMVGISEFFISVIDGATTVFIIVVVWDGVCSSF